MPDPFTPITVLTFVGTSIASGIIGNRSDAKFKPRWDAFWNNLQQYRPHTNHELARVAYRAYLLATLQICGLSLQRNNLKIDGWFRAGVLPEKMATALRALLRDVPQSVFAEAHKQWLEAVGKDHVNKLKELDKQNLDLPSDFEHEQFAALLSEIELLMQPPEAQEREQAIRTTLLNRVLKDLEQFGSVPEKLEAVIKEKWFEFLCANFQYHIKHQQEIANAFESLLLAKLVARSEWQRQLIYLTGEGLKGLEAVVVGESKKIQEELKVIQDKLDKFDPPPVVPKLEPLIHTLPTQQEIEGRWIECEMILRAMASSKEHVVTFAAPGGFGKTALLAKVVQQLAPDGKTILHEINLPNGETLETNTTALLHVDCRTDVKLSVLFANAGRLIGQEQLFQNESDGALAGKLQEIFSELSKNDRKRTWLLFDNFEPLLNNKGEIASNELRDFFGAIFLGEHNVYVLVSGREVPRFSHREQVFVLSDVGAKLVEGLPLADCIAYLKKNGAEDGLDGPREEVDSVLRDFANKVHRIPLALVWAIGYLRDTDFTLKDILEKQELFEDFDQEQSEEAERYEYRGLKRLHYEQLKIQSSEALSILRLLAFFKRSVPKGALAQPLDNVELNKVLKLLKRNKLITHKKSKDPYTRHLNNHLEINLYALHPVICENDFFDSLPDKEQLYKAVAHDCWGRADKAYKVKHFAYAHDLTDCAGKLYEYLRNELHSLDVLREYAAMLIARGEVLRNLSKLPESVAETSKAITLLEPLVREKQKSPLANDLATAYLNKGNALYDSEQLPQAVTEFESAITILKSLFDNGSELKMAESLAIAYTNKGAALLSLGKFPEANEEHKNAIAILERLVYREKRSHLTTTLARAYLHAGHALLSANEEPQADDVNNKGIRILEDLVNVQNQKHLANELAESYVIKARVLAAQEDWEGALASYEQAFEKRIWSVEQLGMRSIMPALLEVLHYRLTTLIKLQRWPEAGQDIRKIISLHSTYLLADTLEKSLKDAAIIKFDEIIVTVRQLSVTERESLYAELGEEADSIRSLVEEGN